MTLFLRNKKNETIVDIDCYKSHGCIEVSSVVCIEPYSKFLLDSPESEREGIIRKFDLLQELRGWLWENYFGGRQNTDVEYPMVLGEIKYTLKDIAKKYDLGYVED